MLAESSEDSVRLLVCKAGLAMLMENGWWFFPPICWLGLPMLLLTLKVIGYGTSIFVTKEVCLDWFWCVWMAEASVLRKPWLGPKGLEAMCMLLAGISEVLFVTEVFTAPA